MTLAFTTAELTGQRAAQSDHYNDACKIGTYTVGTADAYNNPNPTWPLGSEIACGFMTVKVDEGLAEANVPLRDGQFRLPIGTAVTSKDRIQLTKRHGSTLAAAVKYQVIGEPKRGPSGLVVDVKVVTDGS